MNSMSVIGCVLAALILPMTIASAISQLKQEALSRRAGRLGADTAVIQRRHTGSDFALQPRGTDGTPQSVPHSAPYALSASGDPASGAVPIAPHRPVDAPRGADRPGDGEPWPLRLRIRDWWP
jgi:hypothetical protein